MKSCGVRRGFEQIPSAADLARALRRRHRSGRRQIFELVDQEEEVIDPSSRQNGQSKIQILQPVREARRRRDCPELRLVMVPSLN
jgi:hypothetical protein